jgi:hypothetical protein
MSPKSFARLLGLALALPLLGCAAYQAQHQAAKPRAVSRAAEAAPVSVNPKGEFSELQPDLQIARVKGELKEIKDTLAQQGAYSCCVDPPCTECLLRRGHCPCRDAVRKKGAACGECAQGWVQGRGIVEGADAKEVVERSRKAADEAAQKNTGETPPPEHQHH